MKYEYQKADEFLMINDRSKILKPIKIPLPKPPKLEKIDGYGLPPEDQKWVKPKMPQKLKEIVHNHVKPEKIWEIVESRRGELRDEIEWIKKQWYYRLNGYWFFNNGKPTYITGSHFFYLSAFRIDNGFPEYRDTSRKWFHAINYFYTYHYDFKKKEFDVQGNRLPNNPGDEEIDLGRRNVFGLIFPKKRRLGATFESLAFMLDKTTVAIQAHSGLQSIDESHGRRTFSLKLVPAWRKLPFFFMPRFDGNIDPQKEIKFLSKETDNIADVGLESKITYATSSSSYFYDQEKLLIYIRDEAGKVIAENIHEGWPTVKQCLGQGDGMVINGFGLFPSTSGKFDKEGGESFSYLIQDSDFYQRTPNGQTKSGLVTVFIPADEGLEGYIDAYGNSVKEKPTPEQKKALNVSIGATEYLLAEREHFLKMGTIKSIEDYRTKCRLYPLDLDECFLTDSHGSGFNMIILDKRISELRFNDKLTTRGNFEWLEGKKDTKVIFREDPINGKWLVSKLLPEGQSNLKFFRDGHWYPYHRRKIMHCGDPFSFDETEHARMSMGGMLGMERRNKEVDTDEKNILDWETPRIIYTYSFRETETDKFAEDCLLANIYYGGLMNPESNIELIRKHYKRRGYAGYLLYMHDDQGGYRNTAGYHLRNNADKMLGLAADFIERHGHKCNHIEVLQQCKDLRGKKDITNKDLVAVLGGCLLGIDDDYDSVEQSFAGGYDISSFLNKRKF